MKEASHTCEGDEWSYIHEAKPSVEGSKSHTGIEKKKKQIQWPESNQESGHRECNMGGYEWKEG